MNAFEKIIGQTTAIALLKSAIKQDRLAPAYLFTGIEGIGRKLTALAFAEAVINDPKSSQRVQARNHPDLMWVEPTYIDKGKLLNAAEAAGLKKRAAPQIRLEQIRGIGEFLSQPPLESRRSLVIIEEAQTMPEAAANALLKTLEEPGKATIILIAQSVSSLLPTLVSRCHLIPFFSLGNDQLLQVLAQQEIYDISPEMIDLAGGSVGAAIANLNQLQNLPTEILDAAKNICNQPYLSSPQISSQEALSLAKDISKGLELEAQIWLLNYLQVGLWHNSMETLETITALELAKQQLNSYVQPRLVWEVLLLNF
jgi:DNA polymerase III subunit delta'